MGGTTTSWSSAPEGPARAPSSGSSLAGALLSGGKASVSKLFVHTGTGERGLAANRDVVGFDEISSTSVQGQEAASALKDYMASGQATRGKESVQGAASIAFLGNIDLPVGQIPSGEHTPGGTPSEESHLFVSVPDRVSGDTALTGRIHAYLPGWEVPKIGPEALAEGWGPRAAFCWGIPTGPVGRT